MNANEMISGPQPETGNTVQMSVAQHSGAKYAKVFDKRKRRIRGLWKRGDRFYAQMTFETSTGQKVVRRIMLEDTQAPPQPVTSEAEAVKAMERLRVRRDDTGLPAPKQTPKLQDFALDYERDQLVKKMPSTQRNEKLCIRRLNEFFGQRRLREINIGLVRKYTTWRKEKLSTSKKAGHLDLRGEVIEGERGTVSINREIITLRNILAYAVECEKLRVHPLYGAKLTLEHEVINRSFISDDDLAKLCETAIKHGENGRQLADWIKLMALSGGRQGETLRLRWSDVNFDERKLVFGADGLSKNGESREVHFYAALEKHLRDMHQRRCPDTVYLFPSPKFTKHDRPLVNFNKSLGIIRKASGVLHFTTHACRRYFITKAVMAGIDYKTISEWAGHSDGGILVATTYSKLADGHKKEMANKMSDVIK